MAEATPEGWEVGRWRREGDDLVMVDWFSGTKKSFFVPPGDVEFNVGSWSRRIAAALARRLNRFADVKPPEDRKAER